jgi:hypothetical protein
LRQAERKIGQLTMENEVLRAAAETNGVQIPPAKRPRWPWPSSGRWRRCAACSARRARRSTLVAEVRPGRSGWAGDLDQRPRPAGADPPSPGRLTPSQGGLSQDPRPPWSRAGIRVSGKRVLRLLRREGLLAPQWVRGRRKPRPMTARSSPRDPALGHRRHHGLDPQRWWIWVFACIDHDTAEAWAHVAKVGNRFAALQPVYDAVIDRWGRLTPTSPRVCSCGTTGARSIARPTSSARSAGWASATTRRSSASPKPTAVPSGGSGPSTTSACGPNCTTPSTSCARPWPASSTDTTAPG